MGERHVSYFTGKQVFFNYNTQKSHKSYLKDIKNCNQDDNMTQQSEAVREKLRLTTCPNRATA